MRDLCVRTAFIASWLELGQPRVFSLPSFFFPQSFVTALLQNHARQTGTAIDRLSLAFVPTPLRSGAQVTEVRSAASGCHSEHCTV